jgi:hypothetical protein
MPLVAGPILIVAAVLVVFHDFAFGGKITAQHHDILTSRLPDYCFLGQSLAAGRVPAWNPHVMGGTPFAADPQSGWMNLPAMLLFSALSCDVAIRWFFVLQPLLAGVGMYLFLRSERLSPAAATVGGLVLSLGLAGSFLAASLPFAGTIAWTPLTLAAASRYLAADRWPARLAWAAVVATAWGQLAATHLSNGLVMGTALLAAFVAAKLVRKIRRHDLGRGTALALTGVLVVSLLLVNLAVFLPRLAYLPRTSISMGYERLLDLNARLAGGTPRQFVAGQAADPPWPLKYATSPGTYLGAAALLVAFAGLWSRERRHLAVGFLATGAVLYLASLRPVARGLSPLIRSWPGADFYLHRPWRFSVGVLVAMAVLAGLGIEAWRERRSVRARFTMVLPGLVLWGALPAVVGADLRVLALPLVGAAVGGAALAGVAFRPALAAVLPALLAVELATSALSGQATTEPKLRSRAGYVSGRVPFGANPLLEPEVLASDYLRPGNIVEALWSAPPGRYLTVGGYVYMLREHQWSALAAQRAALFGVEDAQGYNATQLRRYWMYVRTVNRGAIKYNFAELSDPPASALDLLQVRWFVVSAVQPPPPGTRERAADKTWVLYERLAGPPRASLLGRWTAARSPEEALETVTEPDFDAGVEVVLENPPETPADNRTTGTATYRALSPQAAVIEVSATGPGIVLIRNVHDTNWRARMDGQVVPLLRADYFLQAVAVPPGRHTILLSYDDPWIGYGGAGSGVSVALLIAGALVLGRRKRRIRDEEPSSERAVAVVSGSAGGSGSTEE